MSGELVLSRFSRQCHFSSGRPAALAAPTPEIQRRCSTRSRPSPQAKLGPWLSNIYAEYKEAAGKA